MEPYNEVEQGVYPTPMTSNPAIWGMNYKTFLYPIFAVYFEKHNRFALYRIRVAESYHILEPYKSERPDPFYLHSMGNPSDPPTDVYSAPSQFSFCTWFQKAWLCKRNGTAMSPIFPVMKLTNCARNCYYSKYYSTSVYASPAALEWADRVRTTDKSILRIALNIAKPIPYAPITPKPTIPSFPAFVVNLLLEEAISKKQDCPITMEPITKESAAVTSCYHIFDRDSITSWLKSNKTCPVCKQTCCLPSLKGGRQQ